MPYKCQNCTRKFSDEEVENGRGVYTRANSDPYLGIEYDEPYCKYCMDEYKHNTGRLEELFRGRRDRIDFRLREI